MDCTSLVDQGAILPYLPGHGAGFGSVERFFSVRAGLESLVRPEILGRRIGDQVFDGPVHGVGVLDRVSAWIILQRRVKNDFYSRSVTFDPGHAGNYFCPGRAGNLVQGRKGGRPDTIKGCEYPPSLARVLIRQIIKRGAIADGLDQADCDFLGTVHGIAKAGTAFQYELFHERVLVLLINTDHVQLAEQQPAQEFKAAKMRDQQNNVLTPCQMVIENRPVSECGNGGQPSCRRPPGPGYQQETGRHGMEMGSRKVIDLLVRKIGKTTPEIDQGDAASRPVHPEGGFADQDADRMDHPERDQAEQP